MWINKKEYDALVRVADNNRDDAEAFRSIMLDVKRGSIIRGKSYVMMSQDVYDKFVDMIDRYENEKPALEGRIKILTTERDQYKRLADEMIRRSNEPNTKYRRHKFI
jgi:hypothetical protein